LAPTKKSKRADSSAAADDEKTQAGALFKAPVGLPVRPTDNKKVGPQKANVEEKKKSKKSKSSASETSSEDGSDLGGYPSSVPSTPQSSDFSFTSASDLSETGSTDGDEASSIDEFANNTLEISLDAATTQKIKDKIKGTKNLSSEIAKELNPTRAVICLSHIPFGFFEEQMKKFFSQFGTVLRLRLSRAKRSGRSRGYAFVEFDDTEVAQIVAETMNDYLMYGRRLKCEVIPPEKVHPSTFLGSKKVRKDRTEDAHRIHRLAHNRSKSQKEMDENVRRLLQKEEKRRAKLEALGVPYEFDGFSAQAPTKSSLPDLSSLSATTKSKAK
jgi:RNA recognition motif-containing protein